eukprot:symbB.v1.2.019149.t1/scaffold1555.1/size186957/3
MVVAALCLKKIFTSLRTTEELCVFLKDRCPRMALPPVAVLALNLALDGPKSTTSVVSAKDFACRIRHRLGMEAEVPLKTVRVVLEKVLAQPTEERLRRLKASNVRVQRELLAHPEAVALLQLAGFTSSNGDLVLSSGAALAPLREVLQSLHPRGKIRQFGFHTLCISSMNLAMFQAAARTFVVIVDESKLCDGLGPHFPIPVEVVPFCHEHTARVIKALPALEGCEPMLRLGSAANNKRDGDTPAVTDNGNYILDLHFKKPIKDARAAAKQLKSTIGVVEHGFFTDMTSVVIVAGKEGIYEKKPKGWLFSRF